MHSSTSLLADLATICANHIQPAHDMPAFTMITTPTPLQRRAFELLGISHRHGPAQSVPPHQPDHQQTRGNFGLELAELNGDRAARRAEHHHADNVGHQREHHRVSARAAILPHSSLRREPVG